MFIFTFKDAKCSYSTTAVSLYKWPYYNILFFVLIFMHNIQNNCSAEDELPKIYCDKTPMNIRCKFSRYIQELNQITNSISIWKINKSFFMISAVSPRRRGLYQHCLHWVTQSNFRAITPETGRSLKTWEDGWTGLDMPLSELGIRREDWGVVKS